MDKVPEMVNLLEFADNDREKVKADKPMKFDKADFNERRRMKPGEIKAWSDDQRPEYKKKTVRKEACPFCTHIFKKLEVICPRCHNCQACGSYVEAQGDLICNSCGNFHRPKTDEPPIIRIGG